MISDKKKDRLLKKKEVLKNELNRASLYSVASFNPIDLIFGILWGLISICICIWIPILGWVLIPIIIIICPFIGTYIRQKYFKKKAAKLQESLNCIDTTLSL